MSRVADGEEPHANGEHAAPGARADLESGVSALPDAADAVTTAELSEVRTSAMRFFAADAA